MFDITEGGAWGLLDVLIWTFVLGTRIPWPIPVIMLGVSIVLGLVCSTPNDRFNDKASKILELPFVVIAVSGLACMVHFL